MNQLSGTTRDESYIGDGLYATFDGWQIILRAPRSDGDHWVALEPELFTNLVRFAERINGKYQVHHFNALRSGSEALVDMQGYIIKLEKENWALKQALGYPIPADKETINNPFKCGICDARNNERIDKIEQCAKIAEDWGLGRVAQEVKDYPATCAAAIAHAIRKLAH